MIGTQTLRPAVADVRSGDRYGLKGNKSKASVVTFGSWRERVAFSFQRTHKYSLKCDKPGQVQGHRPETLGAPLPRVLPPSGHPVSIQPSILWLDSAPGPDNLSRLSSLALLVGNSGFSICWGSLCKYWGSFVWSQLPTKDRERV